MECCRSADENKRRRHRYNETSLEEINACGESYWADCFRSCEPHLSLSRPVLSPRNPVKTLNITLMLWLPASKLSTVLSIVVTKWNARAYQLHSSRACVKQIDIGDPILHPPQKPPRPMLPHYGVTIPSGVTIIFAPPRQTFRNNK